MTLCAGVRVSNATFNAIAMRYSDNNGRVLFNDFVAAFIKLKLLFGKYNDHDCSTFHERASVRVWHEKAVHSCSHHVCRPTLIRNTISCPLNLQELC